MRGVNSQSRNAGCGTTRSIRASRVSVTRYLWSLAPASSPSRAAPSATSWSTSHRMCGRQVLQERLAEAEDRVLRSLHVDLHHDPRRLRDQGGDGVQRSEVDLLASVEPHPRRVEGGERRAPFARRDPHRLVGIPDALPMDHDAVIDPVPARVRLQRVGHGGDDLERVDVDVRRVGGHRHREQARVRADVEERVGPSSERGHRVQRQPIVGVRPTAPTPEELLRVLASCRVEHHERHAAQATSHFLEAGQGREADPRGATVPPWRRAGGWRSARGGRGSA